MPGNDLQRFTLVERVIHWVVGLAFVLLLLTGLALSYPSLFWLTAVVGGGPAARALHPWIGLVFTVSLVVMVVLWLRDMRLGRADLEWMRAVGYYARHQRDKVPPTGKYNGGQKIFFWVESILGLVFVVTGVPLWFPEPMSSEVLMAARFLHYLATLGGGLFLIGHVYLGTIAYPGTAGGMLYGTVSREWAKLHAPLWYEEQVER